MGLRLDGPGLSVAYTGDCGPDPALVDLGRGVDLFIMDATDRPGEVDQAQRRLMTAVEAATWARRAGAAQLMLSHFWPGNDRDAARVRAQRTFEGPVWTAEEGLAVELHRARSTESRYVTREPPRSGC